MPSTTHLIGAFGLHWERREVNWHPGSGRAWQLLGRGGNQSPGLRVCDFRYATGVYVLEKRGRPVYAGLARSDLGIGARLLRHTDDGTKNWTRFSWFSFDDVWIEERRKTYPPYPRGWALVDPRERLDKTEMRHIVGELEALLVNLIFDGRLVSNIQRPKFAVAKHWEQITAQNFRSPGIATASTRPGLLLPTGWCNACEVVARGSQLARQCSDDLTDDAPPEMPHYAASRPLVRGSSGHRLTMTATASRVAVIPPTEGSAYSSSSFSPC